MTTIQAKQIITDYIQHNLNEQQAMLAAEVLESEMGTELFQKFVESIF